MSTLISGVFDKYTVTKVDIVPGSTTQSTGVWVPAVETETAGTAHVSDLSIQELTYIDPAIVSAGARKMAVESSRAIVPGDHVKITELDGSTITEWEVVSKMSAGKLFKTYLNESRETFLLRRLI